MTGLEEDAIEPALINKSLNQGDLESMCVAIFVRCAFTEHRYLAITKPPSRSSESVLISGLYGN
jgi:hypothetical protein